MRRGNSIGRNLAFVIEASVGGLQVCIVLGLELRFAFAISDKSEHSNTECSLRRARWRMSASREEKPMNYRRGKVLLANEIMEVMTGLAAIEDVSDGVAGFVGKSEWFGVGVCVQKLDGLEYGSRSDVRETGWGRARYGIRRKR